VDLYFILKEKDVALQKFIDIAHKKYKEEFDPRLFLEQLLYFDDIPFTPAQQYRYLCHAGNQSAWSAGQKP